MSSKSSWTPIRTGSMSERISERILEQITTQELRPGDRLPPERELAALLGVGRPALREALQALRTAGRVQIKHGVGVFVADPAMTLSLRSAVQRQVLNLEELYDMRTVLELPAASWAAEHQDREKLEEVRASWEKLDEASSATAPDWPLLQKLDADFHLRIVEAAGNRFLVSTQGVLQSLLTEGMDTTLRIPGRLKRSRAEHKKILDAILRGDSNAARNAVRTHINGARSAALDRSRSPER